jgi:hypothetical protein
MSWADRLLGITSGGEVPESVARLPAACARGLHILTRCADLAPTPAAEADLRRLTATATALVHRVRVALRDYAPAFDNAPAGDGPLGPSHWARLVSALEQHRELRILLIEAAAAFVEADLELGRQLEQLGREQEAVNDELRDLIARADPQAAD